MGTELRRVTYGNHGVARLTPAPDKPGTYMGMPKFSKAVKGELNLSVQRKNCLLYTSPSPRDVEESRMPSSA